MVNAHDIPPGSSRRQNLNDLGWFTSIFSMVVGAPSVLSLIEIAMDFRLTDAFRWIVDGYNRLVALLMHFLEPPIIVVLDRLGEWISLDLKLHEHWRPLLIIGLIFVISAFRHIIEGSLYWRVLVAAMWASIALFASITAGMIPAKLDWLSSGLIVATYSTIVLGFLVLPRMIWQVVEGTLEPKKVVIGGPIILGVTFLCSFVYGTTDEDARVMAVIYMLMFVTFYLINEGRRQGKKNWSRAGLTIAGAFILAGGILVADQLLKYFT